MKKIICLITLLAICCISLGGCDSGSDYTSENYDTDYESESSIITESEAEGRATAALYNQLKALNIYDDSFDISQTRYTVASISGSASSGYTVNGTYSLYDKYGNFKGRENFSVRVDSSGYARVTEY